VKKARLDLTIGDTNAEVKCPSCGNPFDLGENAVRWKGQLWHSECANEDREGRARPTQQQMVKEVIREKEVITIVKIHCRHCGTLFEQRANFYPHCGAPP